MGSTHGDGLERAYRDGDSAVHGLPAQCKIAALVGFVLVIVVTPREWFWVFAAYAALLTATAAVARLPPGFVLRRATVELPFVLFALLLPVLARGPRVHVVGLDLSRTGLLAAWAILVKGTLGVTGSVVLAATTRPPDLLHGLRALRLPATLVQIATFMLRYTEVVTAELRQMRVARESRGFTGRGPRALGVLARSAGALFVRSYERGERVYLAMCSRGYTGVLPVLDPVRASGRQWAAGAALPTAALVVLATAWWAGR